MPDGRTTPRSNDWNSSDDDGDAWAPRPRQRGSVSGWRSRTYRGRAREEPWPFFKNELYGHWRSLGQPVPMAVAIRRVNSDTERESVG